ncbi:MAG: hypothetical protein AB8B50_11425 [Pirellulaceae bacterium]
MKWNVRALTVRLFTLLFGIGIGLLLCEVGLRLFVSQETKRLAVYDSQLGWTGRPFGRGTYIRSADNIRVDFQYNNLGFRDDNVPAKPINGRRLMMIGDSFIESLEVPFNQTFPFHIKKSLKEQNKSWDACVIGSQGYSTAQELKAFLRYQPNVDPDLALLFFYCGNDFEDNLRPSFAFLDENQEVQLVSNEEPVWKVHAKKLQRWMYESSHLVFLLKNKLQSLTAVEFGPTSKNAVEVNEETKRKITDQLLSLMARDSDKAEVEFGIVIIPFRDELAAGDDTKPKFVRDLCMRENIRFLDLSNHLSKEHYFESDVHFNESGHQIVGQAVSEFVLKFEPFETPSNTNATVSTNP